MFFSLFLLSSSSQASDVGLSFETFKKLEGKETVVDSSNVESILSEFNLSKEDLKSFLDNKNSGPKIFNRLFPGQ